jgi:hypothetical protein
MTEKLKKGSSGSEVEALQTRLRELGYYGGNIDGQFGPITERGVLFFQKAQGLKEDGIVGQKTWASLELKEIPQDSSRAPKRPRNYSEVKSIFGDPLSSGWSKANLAFCEVAPTLKAFPIKKDSSARGFYCHKLLVSVFQKVFEEIVLSGLTDEIKTFEGCFNIRKIRGSSTNMSLHSWAIAIDLNYKGNELGNAKPEMDPRVIAVFEKYGFYWGGKFKRRDGMHFEYFNRG